MSLHYAVGRTGTILLMVLIFILALAPREALPTVEGWNDKGEHFAAFWLLSLGLALYWSLSGGRVALLLTLYGGLIEVAQSFTPCRQASLLDLLADIAGILAGLLMLALWRGLAGRSASGSEEGITAD